MSLTTSKMSGTTWMGPWSWAPSDKRLIDGVLEGEWSFSLAGQNVSSIDTEKQPEESYGGNFLVEYRGYSPVRILGIYLAPIPSNAYAGERTSEQDILELARWGDEYAKTPIENSPGVVITQVDQDGITHFALVTGSQGSSPSMPIEFISTETKKIQYGESFTLGITIRAPSANSREVERSRRFHFGLEILAEDLSSSMNRGVPQSTCGEE